MVMPDKIVNEVYDWAKENKAILFIDIQTGHSDIRSVLPRFEWLLKNPDVHLAIDPEFNLIKSGRKPGAKIGTYDAADANYAIGFLKDLVKSTICPPRCSSCIVSPEIWLPTPSGLSPAPKCRSS